MGTYHSEKYLVEDCNFCYEQTMFIDYTIPPQKIEIKKQALTICRDCFKKFGGKTV